MFRILFGLFVVLSTSLFGQQTIALEEIWSQYKFSPSSISGIRSMNDGQHYTVLEADGIDKYAYATQKKIDRLALGAFSDYAFNSDESYLILEQNPEPIYRRSKKAVYTLLHRTTGKKHLVHDGKPIQEPLLSPDGKKVAFVYKNNLFVQNLENQSIRQLTQDGEKNKIINGITDWVYEEEFGFVRAFDWNGNSDKLAFIRFDEERVPQISMTMYGEDLYPSQFSFKYPKAGEENAKVSVWIMDLKSNKKKNVDLSSYSDFYVPKIQFNTQAKKDANDLFVFVSNRHQNQLDVLKVNAENFKSELLFTEKDKAWIETDNLTFVLQTDSKKEKSQGFIWSSERDGYRHLYAYDYAGKLKKQLTKGEWEITDFYGYSASQNSVYFQSTRKGSKSKSVTKAILGRTTTYTDLTEAAGTNVAQFSSDFSYFINKFASSNIPPIYTLRDGGSGSVLHTLERNERVAKLLKAKQVARVEHSQLAVNGNELNMWMIKPANYDPNKAYPLFMYQYSGPGSQEASDDWDSYNYWWFQMLAQQGYMIACIDGRGTGGKGAAFKKATYLQLGKLEIEDQIAAAKLLGERKDIDAERIGIFGWSFGGYMSSLALTKGADVFKLGIAVAPVTNWRFYDTVYTERFMRTPQENPSGYDTNSPINHVNKMKGKYLLIHGSADDNVHPQNTFRMNEALVQANKSFDSFIYTDRNHGIYGGNTRLHLYKKMTDFIQTNL